MILALDVGQRRIGVAVSDPGESFSLPVGTIERTALHRDLDAIVALAREYGAETIVVGDPLALSGERGVAAQRMDAFVAVLSKAWSGSIERIDERLTTAQVTRSLIDADVSRKKRKGVVDQLAASLILDSYLARRRRER
ncbi:MAG: Holliday junction resolvase RuvX [Candidatus Baltobacteraceae bacterium]|jgi:putative Holliday junction resolvase